jgi:ribosomal protein S14
LLAVAFIIYPFHATMALSNLSQEPVWATHHIEGLPRELRSRVLALQTACGDAIAARHYFSTSMLELCRTAFRESALPQRSGDLFIQRLPTRSLSQDGAGLSPNPGPLCPRYQDD